MNDIYYRAFSTSEGKMLGTYIVGDGTELSNTDVVMMGIEKPNKKIKIVFEGDIVKVIGKKRIGTYNTTVVRNKWGGLVLLDNRTYLNDNASLLAIDEILGNIHEDNPETFIL